jgi:hypothetical protein
MRYEGADLLGRLLWGDRRGLRQPERGRGFRVGPWTLAHETYFDGGYGEGESWEAAFLDADVDPLLVDLYRRKYPSVEPGDETLIRLESPRKGEGI